MDKIETRKIGSLRLHPDNIKIFGLPTDEPNYEEIREDIRKKGLQEPLIILKDGTILSGHIRYAGVWWTLEQKGLTKELIEQEMIAVRVHPDFSSKEEELEYLMDANDKRRHLDPRRIATVFERVVQVIESGSKNGKKGDALKGLADRLGTSHKLAKNYCIIFSSKIVPEEYKDRVNSKAVAPSTILEAIKFAEDSAKREKRAPSADDVVIYLKNPRTKTSVADTIREAAKGTSVSTSTSAPAPTPKPAKATTVEVAQEPPKVEEPPTPEPPNVKEWAEKNVHTEHCCLEHGCKYNDLNCPVATGKQKQSHPCEMCGLESEGYFDDMMVEGHRDLDDEVHRDPLDDEESYPDSEKITYARRLLKEALRTIVLDSSVTSDLLGLHTELTSYLRAMKLIDPSPSLSLPTDVLGQLSLCTSLVEGIGEVPDPQATRDALLDLVSLAKISIDRLTTTKRTLEPNGLYCPECLEPQVNSPSGATCANGHGGCVGISEAQAGQIKLSQEVTESKFKCCFCSSRVEIAPHATHATCPKCGLVDTADIEPVEPLSKDAEIDVDLLDEVINSDLLAPEEPSSNGDISADELAALLDEPTPEPPPKKSQEPKEPKKNPVAQAKSLEPSNDPDSALVSAVIDDFEDELRKVGLTTTA